MGRKRHNAVCAVATCHSPKDDSVIYHMFPKSEEVCQKWKVACKRQDPFNPKTSSICSEHFVASDYERDLQGELLGLPLKRRLKKDAFPTANLPVSPNAEKSAVILDDSVDQREKRKEKREQKSLVKEILTSQTSTSKGNNFNMFFDCFQLSFQ